MNPIQIIGQVLLWGGFLGAAYTSVCQLEVVDDKWATISWPAYFGSAFVGIVGIMFLRRSNRDAVSHSDRVDTEFSTLTSSIEILTSSVGTLRKQLGDSAPHSVVEFIDDKLAVPFSDFADARNALIQRFGMQGFADVMTEFASGERFVNRAWSAAADGYMGEVSASLERAERHLQKASQLIVELDK